MSEIECDFFFSRKILILQKIQRSHTCYGGCTNTQCAYLGVILGSSYLGVVLGSSYLGVILGSSYLGVVLGSSYLGVILGSSYLGVVLGPSYLGVVLGLYAPLDSKHLSYCVLVPMLYLKLLPLSPELRCHLVRDNTCNNHRSGMILLAIILPHNQIATIGSWCIHCKAISLIYNTNDIG